MISSRINEKKEARLNNASSQASYHKCENLLLSLHKRPLLPTLAMPTPNEDEASYSLVEEE